MSQNTEIERLWAKIDKRGPDECWPWMGGKIRGGYGTIRRHNGPHRVAHGLVFEQAFGPVPAGMVLRHTCHNPGCCNPGHLLLGTHQDNMMDRQLANRQAKGETQGLSKLTAEQVVAIRNDGRSQRTLAREYGVAQSTIGRAKRAATWRHL